LISGEPLDPRWRLPAAALVILLGAAVLSAVKVGRAGAVRARLALGAQVYADHCAVCHGPNGEGEYPQAPLSPGADGQFPAPPHDSTGHTWHHPDGLIETIILEGRIDPGFKPMPAFGEELSPVEIEAVIAFIKTWWTPEQVEAQATISACSGEE